MTPIATAYKKIIKEQTEDSPSRIKTGVRKTTIVNPSNHEYDGTDHITSYDGPS